MRDDVRQIEPADDEIQEEWLRETDEGEIRDVGAARIDEIGGWQVSVWALANVRELPLEAELRDRIISALRAVSGVTSAEEQDRETYFVTGTPSGKSLVEAVGLAVDSLANRTRAHLYGIDGS
jgi:hypothetical protein